MKKSILTLALGMVSLGCFALVNRLSDHKPIELSIKEAIEKGILELKISGAYDRRIYYEVLNADGVHFGKCMAIVLKSKIDSTVLLRLDCGTQLIPADTSVTFDELKKYGADSITIAKSKDILYCLNLSTKLTPKTAAIIVPVASEIKINRYVFYTGLGLLLFTSTMTIILFFRGKNNESVIG